MWRWIKRLLIALSALIVVVVSAGGLYQWMATRADLAETPPPGRLVDIGGHRLHIWCLGEGAPAVILEAGLGGSSVVWGLVQPEVARFTRACSYDRAGMGYSDPGPSPRTARRMAQELHLLLDRAGISGPVVLAGASIGGYPVRVFASAYADRAAGLVLVDASHEDQHHEVPQLAPFVPFLSSVGAFRLIGMTFGVPADSLAPAVRKFARATNFRAAGYRAAADELIHARDSAAEVKAARRTLTIPLIVVTGGRGNDGEWRDLQRDQVALSARGCQIVAEQSGHVVPVEQPEAVVEAIRAVVDATRQRGGSDLPPAATDAIMCKVP